VFFWFVATSGGDQLSVQRFISTENAKAARKAIGLQLMFAFAANIGAGVIASLIFPSG